MHIKHPTISMYIGITILVILIVIILVVLYLCLVRYKNKYLLPVIHTPHPSSINLKESGIYRPLPQTDSIQTGAIRIDRSPKWIHRCNSEREIKMIENKRMPHHSNKSVHIEPMTHESNTVEYTVPQAPLAHPEKVRDGELDSDSECHESM